DIVVEAVFEDLALKRQVFAELGRVTRPTCILATNTSTLDVDAIATACGRPSRVVGHHFFSPANIMTLLEIVRGRETEPDVLATSLSLAKRLGKQPVMVGNCFGFVANRMLGYYLREALLLVEEGATVVQVDGAMTAFGLPVGPFTMEDIAGIDVGARIRRHRAAEGLGWAEGPQSRLPDRLHAMGRFGQKTGAGWYRYLPGSRVPVPDPVVDELAAEEARARGIARRAVSDDEIVARLATAITNEGAQILDDGFAQRAGDIDVIYCHGFGYPRWRGGPMFYADSCGLPVILERLRHYRTQFGDYWRAAPLLERLVAEGRGFYTQRTGA
ncbi:MAG: 3-hydroxyacyl-CoA dehydrogenase family protein, partial [Vicinamibacterales bacterium]